MKNTRSFLASLLALAFTASAFAGGEGWSDNYKESIGKAKAEKKLLFVEFTGSDWCPPCKKQAAEVFAQQDFKDYAAKHLVLLELDFPRSKPLTDEVKAQNKELKDKYGIRGYPTVIVFDGDSKELARWVGYGTGGSAAMIAKLDALKK